MASSVQSRPKRRLHITCAAWTCNSPKVGVSYHRFPKDKNLNRQWRDLCRVGDVKEPRICSRHFHPEDFKRDLVNELLNRPTKKLLKSDAVPSLLLFKGQTDPPASSPAQRHQQEEESRRKREELIQRLLTKGPDPPPAPIEPKAKHVGVQVFEAPDSQISKLQSKNSRLQTLIEQQKAKIAELQSSLRKINDEDTQKKKRRKVKKWAREDILYALRLRQVSPKAYAFIRRSGQFPLPGLSTLRNWIRDFRVTMGFQELAWALLKERLKTEQDPRFKLASLVYDEIECRGDVFYEVRRMQVIVLRGLYHKWSYVVYQDLDTPLRKPTLDEVIVKAEEMGLEVWTLSLSMENKEVMEEVVIKNSCFTFSNPVDESRHIYIFPSLPSVIKQARNYALDFGIRLDHQNVLCKSDFESVVKACLPVDDEMDRRRNGLALQTFSCSVAKGMEDADLPLTKVKAVQVLDAYVDVFNSRSKNYKNKVGSAFGVHLEEQTSSIKEAEDLAINMRVMNSLSGKAETDMFPFQYGMIIGIESLIELHNELVLRRGALDYILTRHLTTDIVQSYARKMGGHLGLLSAFETEAILERSRFVMIGRKVVGSYSHEVEEDPIDTLEPLFGPLPKKVAPKKKKLPVLPDRVPPVKKSRKLEEEVIDEKMIKIESLEPSLQLPPEIYIF